MVKYKVRSFYEKNTGTAGADVVIFDDEGDEIDTLLITTESTYNDLVQQLENLDERYVSKSEVLNILRNNIYSSDEIVEINATLLEGHNSDYFAKRDHNHDSLYVPKSHTNILSNQNTAGHTKIINNVSRQVFNEGEALSAYQGSLLNNRLSTLETWVTIYHDVNYTLKTDGHMVHLNVHIPNMPLNSGTQFVNNTLFTASQYSAYLPHFEERSDATENLTAAIGTTGIIYISNSTSHYFDGSTPIYASFTYPKK